MQFSQKGCPGFDLVALRYFQIYPGREINIKARPKADQAETLSPADDVTFLNFANDPSCNQTGNLNRADRLSVLGFDEHRIMLIMRRRLIQIGGKKFSGIILNRFYSSLKGNPVHMNIKNRHKDADFHAGSLKKRAVVNHTRRNNFSIGRRNNATDIIRDNAIRIPEKITDEKRRNKTDQGQQDESQKREYDSCEYTSKYKRIPGSFQREGGLAGYVGPKEAAHLLCPDSSNPMQYKA
jgi:hypothetical protein